MKNWEEVFNKFKSGEMEQRYNELKEKVERNEVETKTGDDGKEYVTKRELTADEYKEFQGMKNFAIVKENIPKVENILEVKEKFKTEYMKMEVEKNKRKTLNAQKTMIQQIENDIKIKLDVRNSLTPFLYASDISDTKREKVKTTLEELNGRVEELQEKYKTAIESFKLEDNLKTKYSELSDKDLRKIMRKVAVKISKCDIVAGELMEGQSWDRIDYKLDNWNKYADKNKIASELIGKKVQVPKIQKQPAQQSQETPKRNAEPAPQSQETPKRNAEPIQQSQEIPERHTEPAPQSQEIPERHTEPAPQSQETPERHAEPAPQSRMEKQEPVKQEPVVRTPEQKERELEEQDFIHNIIKKKENKPAKISDFLTRHPRIAKIVNWIRNINPIAKRNIKKEEIDARKENLRNIVEREKALSKEERPKVIETEKARLEEERESNDFKAYIRKIAEKGSEGIKTEKFDAMKQAAYERETEKFGEEYARKSYEPKDKQNDSEER